MVILWIMNDLLQKFTTFQLSKSEETGVILVILILLYNEHQKYERINKQKLEQNKKK